MILTSVLCYQINWKEITAKLISKVVGKVFHNMK